MFENLSTEDQMKINILAGNCLTGFFKAAAVTLKVGGVALKTSAAAFHKAADIADSTGDIAIAYGEQADRKADEYSDALALCERLLASEKHQVVA